MAIVPLTSMPVAAALTGTEIFYGQQASADVQVTATQLNRCLSYTVAGLPASPGEGAMAFATNGCKVGEGAGAGTGVPVYFSLSSWRVFSTDIAVTS